MIGLRRASWAATVAITATALLGCEEPPKPMPPAMPPPAWRPPADRTAGTAELVKDLSTYDEQVAVLPGPDGGVHRRATADLLANLSRILRLAAGDHPSPGYADAVGVVTQSGRTIAIPGVPTGRVEAAENQALRATATALDEVVARVVYDDAAGMKPLTDAVHAATDVAMTSSGPRHDEDATTAFKAVQAALHRVADDLSATFPKNGPSQVTLPTPTGMTHPMPATMPATMPTNPPTATMPTTTPAATMP